MSHSFLLVFLLLPVPLFAELDGVKPAITKARVNFEFVRTKFPVNKIELDELKEEVASNLSLASSSLKNASDLISQSKEYFAKKPVQRARDAMETLQAILPFELVEDVVLRGEMEAKLKTAVFECQAAGKHLENLPVPEVLEEGYGSFRGAYGWSWAYVKDLALKKARIDAWKKCEPKGFELEPKMTDWSCYKTTYTVEGVAEESYRARCYATFRCMTRG